ncbi:MAG: hypothetical protein V4857_23455 [Pseudomonadota bacterium]
MRNRLSSIITTWPFLIALSVLLLNDWWLKFAYPGSVTGKLSDVAGIAVVAMLLLAAWPARRRVIYLALSAFFLWWKSPLSAPMIAFVNSVAPLPIGRVVDYTDLLALAILPACRQLVANHAAYAISGPALRRLLLAPIACMTIVAITATSVMRTQQEYVVRRTAAGDALRVEELAEAINSAATGQGLACEKRADKLDGLTCRNNNLHMDYIFLDRDAVAFTIQAHPEGLFFGRSGTAQADALRAALKSVLAERFRGLEYVEQLNAGAGRR